MSVYLDIKSLYSHLKVNWNVLMCKICIARRLVVDIFPLCNGNFVPFPSGTLVAHRMRNGSIMVTVTSHICINIFQTECFSAVKFAMGYEKNMSFLVVPKSLKIWKKKIEKIRLDSFKWSCGVVCHVKSSSHYKFLNATSSTLSQLLLLHPIIFVPIES